MADFGKYFPVQCIVDHESLMAAHPKDANGTSVFEGPAHDLWMKQFQAVHERMGKATAAFLRDLASSVELCRLAHLERRRHGPAQAWNRFVDDRDIANESLGALVDHLLDAAMRARYGCSTSADKHAAVVRAMNEGTFEWYETNSREVCTVTGEQLHLEFRNWRPVLGVAAGAGIQAVFTPLSGPAPLPKVEHHVINAPSGQLLFADWFRIPPFTEMMTEGETHEQASDASELRKVARYARSHGVMSVFVGNSSPDIFKRSDHLLIGASDPDQPEPDDQCGRICTDLWRATAVDRQVLISMLARSMPHLEAEKLVQNYIEEHDIAQASVRPGLLHVYHTARAGHMDDFRAPGVPHVEGTNVYAVLSARELQWHHKDSPPTPRRARARP